MYPTSNINSFTAEFLIFSGESIFLFASLVQLVADSLHLGLFVAEVSLGLLVELDGLIQSRFDFNVDLLQVLRSLLELPGGIVGLKL